MKKGTALLIALTLIVLSVSVLGCTTDATGISPYAPKSSSGVSQATTSVTTNVDGHTLEQEGYIKRIAYENDPNKVKYIIVFNQYGQELYTGVVDGKVYSSGKSLTPKSVAAGYNTVVTDLGSSTDPYGIKVEIPVGSGNWYRTSEVMNDDGTYGSSTQYIFWWDTNKIYHQQSIGSGVDYHLSSQPMHMKDGRILFEMANST